ncbi:MAG: hypothetical protein ACM3UR_06935 [Bacteroidota bacterium]|jgi:hypothetical protein|nr:hypothetical protein [Ignavibacteria bacterium]MCU7501270.1 hypothetical protein [Ignavibacteria bacterium]MCU7514538.1 hypothetical protein [Ignavibacteria bacterium]MCU7522538.1 hypothetical protein [Ignavibacteria bacterium]MCU7526409.1 hypothetical protein [Ignavibacteria bacterium]
MKKILFLLIFFSSALINAQDFRNAKWGASVDEIKRTEDAKLVREEDGVLIYSGHIDGKLASIWYLFSDSGLKSVRVKFQTNKEQDYSRYIDTHIRLIVLFTKKYGYPDEGINPWILKYVVSSAEKRKDIIIHEIAGGMDSELTWKSGTSLIHLSLKLSANFLPVHNLTYSAL